MIENVNFNVCKFLKEKNFNLNYKIKYASFSKYSDALEYCEKYPNKLTDDSFKIDESYDNEGKVYSCYITLNEFENKPTVAKVVSWFYKKHDIWISVDREPESGVFFFSVDKNKGDFFFDKGDDFNSPTEAYEAAFEYALENLI